jgi:hypothetical protein
MSIAFDAITNNTGRSSVASKTFAHTVAAGTSSLLLVGILHASGQSVSGITYGGVAMAVADSQVNHSGAFTLDLWYLYSAQGLPTGANNVIITYSAATDQMPIAISYTGVKQANFDAYAYSSTTGNSTRTETLTSIADNCWMLWLGVDEYAGPPVAGSGTTLRGYHDGFTGLFFADGNAAIHPAGPNSLHILPQNTSDYMDDMVFTLAPALAGGSATIAAGGGNTSISEANVLGGGQTLTITLTGDTFLT